MAMVTGECRFCGLERPLCRSHIFPEFLYRPSYDDNSRAILMKADRHGRKVVQKGLRERLLCEECEGVLNRIETPYKALQDRLIPDAGAEGVIEVEITADEIRLLRLFHYSILWRASVADGEPFESVDLGPYEDQLRDRIAAGDPGDLSFCPVWAMLVTHEDSPRVLHELVSNHHCARLAGDTACYYSVYGGCEWFILLTDQPDRRLGKIHDAATGFWAKRGVMPLASASLRQSIAARQFVDSRLRAGIRPS